MKAYVIFTLLFAAATSKPTNEILTGRIIAPTSSQFHSQDNLGQYSYGYTDGHSSKVEVKTLDGITRGGYNYIDADGKLQSVQYTSDANGFHVDATNLPVAPQLGEIKEESEVIIARTKEGNEPIEKIAQTPIPPASIPIPATVRLETPTLLAPLPLHTFAPLATVRIAAAANPGIASYSYSIPASALSYATYTTHPFQAEVAYASPILTTNQVNEPLDTPEVAKAKAEHLAAVEEVKARNA